MFCEIANHNLPSLEVQTFTVLTRIFVYYYSVNNTTIYTSDMIFQLDWPNNIYPSITLVSCMIGVSSRTSFLNRIENHNLFNHYKYFNQCVYSIVQYPVVTPNVGCCWCLPPVRPRAIQPRPSPTSSKTTTLFILSSIVCKDFN